MNNLILFFFKKKKKQQQKNKVKNRFIFLAKGALNLWIVVAEP